MLESFHFIRPLWLLALIPLSLLAWRVYRPGGDNPWSRIVDARLLPLLMVGRMQKTAHEASWLVAAGWIIAVLALANPTWERKPQPVYQTSASRVIVLDLSRSMNATDLKPSRLVRARYKVEDVLALTAEGQTGLVVYAADAFTVSPLTRDVKTIRALLTALDPDIMPAQGSRADLGLLKAGELLRQAGASSGQVLLIADGVDPDKVGASRRAAARLRDDGYRVSVIGAGPENAAPLTAAEGEPMRGDGGSAVSPQLDTGTLRSLAHAGGGAYQALTANGDALNALLSDRQTLQADTTAQTDATTQGWKEQGPLLAVLLLPLAALAFRRNWLLGMVVLVGFASPPQTAMASAWDDLWQRPDQQAAKALAAGDYVKAAELTSDPSRRGSAEYKRGNYQQAADNFGRAAGADADYNRGNALAKLGRYQDAVAAYDQSLKDNPGNEDAHANKAAVEALLKQQPQAPQASNPSGGPSQKDQNHNDGGGQNSSPDKAQEQSSKDGKPDQAGASASQAHPPANGTKPDAGSQNAESSRDPGKGDPGQEATSDRGNDQQGQAGTAEQKQSPNEFAEAAKKLGEQKANAAKGDQSRSLPAAAPADATRQAQASTNMKQHASDGSADSAQLLDSEERMAAEQWLRRIPDDPGGLLRRKFLYQYRQRAQHGGTDGD